MALKTIEYTVSASGLSPKVRQDGGVQGDHKVTNLVFTLDSYLMEALRERAEALTDTGGLYYRFDEYNGEGNFISTVPQELTSEVIVFPLEEWITRYGGIIKVVLVITVGDSESTQLELVSYPAILSLKSRPTGSEPDQKEYSSISALSVSATDAAQKAEAAAETAETAMERIEAARYALESGSEVVFVGGDAKAATEIDLVIDSKLDKNSANPVENQVVAEELSSINRELASLTVIEKILDGDYVSVLGKIVGGDYVVEQNNNGIWTERKWNSGRIDRLIDRQFFYTDNPDVLGYAQSLIANGFDGVVTIQIGMGATAPIEFCLGQIICNGTDRCEVILYGQGAIYTNHNVGSGWHAWYKFSGTAVT